MYIYIYPALHLSIRFYFLQRILHNAPRMELNFLLRSVPRFLIPPRRVNKRKERERVKVLEYSRPVLDACDRVSYDSSSLPSNSVSHRRQFVPSLRTPRGIYRGRNEVGGKKEEREREKENAKAVGKVRRGVLRGCLTKGVDKFYAETVKRVSSGK